MNYKIIYEAQRSYGISPIFFIFAISSVIIIFLIVRVWKNQNMGSRIGLAIVIFTIAIILISTLYGYLSSKVLIYDRYVKGECSTVEGNIVNYMQHTDHPPTDTFNVSDTDFYVPGYTTIWGYPIRQRDGGVLKNGLHVRIKYIHYKSENVIMKLEVISGL